MYDIDRQRLLSIMKHRKVTRHDIAVALNLNENTLNRTIRDGRLSESQLNAVSAYLDISSGFLNGSSPYPIPYMSYESIRLEKKNSDSYNDSSITRPFILTESRFLTENKANRKEFKTTSEEIYELLFALHGFPSSAFQLVKEDNAFFDDIGEVILNHVHSKMMKISDT